MPLTIDAIRNANFGPLSQAADFWTTMSQRLAAAHDQFHQDVLNQLGNVWAPFANDVQAAQTALADDGTQLSDAAIETSKIATHLRNAVAAFQQAQSSVLSLLHEADSEGLEVTQPGGGILVSPKDMPPPGSTVPADQAAALNQAVAQAQDLQSRLILAVQAADDADQRAVTCLMDATGGNDTQFTGTPDYDPTQDVKSAADLLNKGNLSKAEQLQLAAILEQNQGNDLFASQLMTSVPPAKVELLALNMGPDDQLTKDLANTLAVASPSLVGNQQWMNAMETAGKQDMTTVPDLVTSKGYVGLSYLIKDGGTFDSSFLTSTGDDMIAYEQMTGNGPKVWTGDVRNDPITNFMTGLQNNPDAAQAFFHQTSNNPAADTQANQARLDYLLNKRTFGPLLGNPALKATGQALEVATTDGTTRTPQQLAILSDTVDTLGSQPHKELPEDLQDSVTNMLTKNIASVHMGLINPVASNTDLPPGVARVAQFEPGTLQNVLAGFSGQKDGASIRQLKGAETVFMVQGLNSIIPPGTGATATLDAKAAVQKLADNSAYVIGNFDAATENGMVERQKAADESHNANVEAMQKQSEAIVLGLVEPYQDGAYKEAALQFVDDAAKMYTVDNSQKSHDAAVNQHSQSAAALQSIVNVWRDKSGDETFDTDQSFRGSLDQGMIDFSSST